MGWGGSPLNSAAPYDLRNQKLCRCDDSSVRFRVLPPSFGPSLFLSLSLSPPSSRSPSAGSESNGGVGGFFTPSSREAGWAAEATRAQEEQNQSVSAELQGKFALLCRPALLLKKGEGEERVSEGWTQFLTAVTQTYSRYAAEFCFLLKA